MTTTGIDIDRSAVAVYAYVTDPSRFPEWQHGVVDGGMEDPALPSSGRTAR
jgi:hypothetical protein